MSDIFDKYLAPKPKQEEHKEETQKYIAKPIAFGNVRNDKVNPSELRNEETTKLKTREDGKPIFNISQSLIKQFTDKNTVIDYCPYKIYTCNIIKSHNTIQTTPMLYGNFFESMCIGGTAYGDPILDLPRKHNGDKTIDQIRIERQATAFKRLCSEYGIQVTKDNTQKRYSKRYKHDFEDECSVNITGVIDMENPIYIKDRFVDCVIDLKLTGSLTNTFGPHAWGNAEYKDHLQFDIYNYISGKPCLYWVFDYSKEENQEMFMHAVEEDDVKAMHDRIRQTIIELIWCMNKDWEPRADYESCKLCPHNPRNGGNCKIADNIRIV